MYRETSLTSEKTKNTLQVIKKKSTFYTLSSMWLHKKDEYTYLSYVKIFLWKIWVDSV